MNLFDKIVEVGSGFEVVFIGFVMAVIASIFIGILCNDKEDIHGKKSGPKAILCYTIFMLGTLLVFGLATYISPKSNENRYYLPAELYGVKSNGCTWLFTDYDGNIWEWEDTTRTYSDDTVYLLSMEANMTFDDVTDDIVLMVWDEGGEEIYYG